MLGNFRRFLTQSNALALAVGVIIGAATGKLVSALADDVLMPIVGTMLPGGGWREAKFVLERSVGPDGKVVENAILYGHLFGAILDFLIIAWVVYLMTKAFLNPAPAPATKVCPQCIETVPVEARRCKACGQPV